MEADTGLTMRVTDGLMLGQYTPECCGQLGAIEPHLEIEMTPRETVIRECIEYLKERPGRKAIQTLEGMIRAEQPKPERLPHPWRKLYKQETK
jgi:hypothetical protein